MTIEEYLELEEGFTIKHEYVAGEIYALAGASGRHNRIANNVSSLLWLAARGSGCRVYQSDMKVRAAEDLCYYPDVVVSCAPEPEDPYYVEEYPCLIVEVVSTSTESTDRREKLAAYKRMPGLKSYLIVAQERRWVERHFRDGDGVWNRADLVEGSFPVPCPPGARLWLDEIYEGI